MAITLQTGAIDSCQRCQFTELACMSIPGSQNVHMCTSTISVSGETCIDIDVIHGTNCAGLTKAVASEHVKLNWTSTTATVQVSK